jgi:hypothetical protein
VNPTKFVVKKTLVDPTKIVAKSAYRAGAGTVSATGKLVKGDVTGAAKSFVKAGLEPVRGGAQLTKHAAKTGLQVTKAVTDLALRPLRGKLNTLKDRRAKKLAWDKRRSTLPTVAERAQARKDVKGMLASKGPHGKMMAWLAGGPMFAGELGVVGYDDAALAAIATALTASAVKIIQDAAKSKFAPADAAKAGAAAGLTTAAEQIAPETTAFVREVQKTTPEEVAQETVTQAEEAATEAATEEVEEALEGAGFFGGFREAADVALAPATMTENVARRIAGAAQRMVCGMSAPALAAIGGLEAINVAGTLCRAITVGDETAVRAVLPSVVQIAARAANDMAARTLPIGIRASGGLPNDGFGAARRAKKGRRAATPFDTCVRFQMNEFGAGRSDAEYACQDYARGLSGSEIGMLAALDGADLEGLAFGLAGVGSDDLAAASAAASMPVLALAPAGIAVLAGLWMAFRG